MIQDLLQLKQESEPERNLEEENFLDIHCVRRESKLLLSLKQSVKNSKKLEEGMTYCMGGCGGWGSQGAETILRVGKAVLWRV